ncbi:MAG: hypothetical protein M3Q79_00890 [bacterium]|nr:hypothetical protein [bacterium]
MHKRFKSGGISISVLVSIVFGLLFVGASIFAVWSFMGMQDYKNNVQPKIDTAVEIAKQETSTLKDNEFIEKEKLPTLNFRGPDTYGAVSFDYPKTWSAVTAKADQTSPLDLTLHPSVVPGSGQDREFSYGLRLEVLNTSYERSVKELDSQIKNAGLVASAFTPVKVPSTVGTRFDGEFVRGKNGVVIMLPLRDKTLKIWTESLDYKKDLLEIIMPSLSFQP